MTWNEAIDSFRTYLILEKSLSTNSVEAYLNDIRKLGAYCEQRTPTLNPKEVSYDVLNEYISALKDTGVTPVLKLEVYPVSNLSSSICYTMEPSGLTRQTRLMHQKSDVPFLASSASKKLKP